MQRPSGTFKTILVLVLGGVAVALVAAGVVVYFLITGGPTPTKKHALREVALTPAAAVPAAPAALAAPVGDPVLFKVRASVSSEDGADVSIEAVPSSEPCTEPRWLDARQTHLAHPADPVNVRAETSWCLHVAPGQHFVPQTLTGRWVTLTDRVLAIDAANQYMRVQHASGRWLGVRAIAAGYCANESSSCSGTALVEVSVDDHNLVVPVAVSSKSREVVRLTSDAELPPAVSRPSPTRISDDEPEQSDEPDTRVKPAAPAQVPTPAPAAVPAAQPVPMPDFVR